MSFDHKFAYSEDGWDPPAPVLQVAIAPAKNDPHLEFSALLDTGRLASSKGARNT